MGTEIFPLIAGLIKIVIAAVAVLAAFVVLTTVVHTRNYTDQQKKSAQVKQTVVSGLTAIGIAAIAYFIVGAIGPVFSALF